MMDPARSVRGELVGVATNVITGFLGAGKSTAILHLLRHRPAGERWAVLVNEFGEVGIDGALLQGRGGAGRSGEGHGAAIPGRDGQGVFVREVPGGCMCCASGVPMQIALTSLLSYARPHRLLIEPTGLGHPHEVLKALGAPHLRKVLDLHATIALVDARKVHDRRYAEHPTFVQQLAVADCIVANKADRYEAHDRRALRSFLERSGGLDDKLLGEVEHGALPLDWLAKPAGSHGQHGKHGHRHDHGGDRDDDHEPAHAHTPLPIAPEIPAAGFVRVDNEGEGFFSRGWVFDPSWTFDAGRLESLLLGVDADRMKGAFRTVQGVVAFNMADGVLTTTTMRDGRDSRVEIIRADRRFDESLEQALLDCVVSRS